MPTNSWRGRPARGLTGAPRRLPAGHRPRAKLQVPNAKFQRNLKLPCREGQRWVLAYRGLETRTSRMKNSLGELIASSRKFHPHWPTKLASLTLHVCSCQPSPAGIVQ